MNMQATVSNQSINPLKPSQLTRRHSPIWPKSLKEAEQLAQLVFDAKLAPKGFGSAKACLVGILFGMELGLSPMAALQKIAIIDGRPTLWGDAALALVQSSGLLGSFCESIEQHIDPSTNHLRWIATCSLTRANLKDPITRTFTSDDAKRAGLWQKPGPWSQYPKRMLTIRARAFALRDAFPDILAGLYIREELDRGNMTEETAKDPDQTNHEAEVIEPTIATEPILKTPKKAEIEPQELEKLSSADEGAKFEQKPIETPTVRRAPPPPVSPPTSFLTEPTQLLEDFDNALCCAFDPETLEEIREEFQPKIDVLGSELIDHAGRIFLRHEQRVQQIDKHSADGDTKSFASEPQSHPVFNPHPRRKRESKMRSSRPPSLSLLALNARQRLSAIKQQSEENRSAHSDQTESETLDDVSTITSPTPDVLTSQHRHSQSTMSIQEPDTVRPSDD